ncbi:MAG: hypothetical protein JF591_03055 [Lysobacter sp.]|nr:hypothetical protein [Lysobacter sp.]
MRLLFVDWIREWHGAQRQRPQLSCIDMDHPRALFTLTVGLGNGLWEEACVESDSQQALDSWRTLLETAGAARLVDHCDEMRASRMYRGGYLAYAQGETAQGQVLNWIFVNPMPRPELFDHPDLQQAYFAEFSRPIDDEPGPARG